MNDGAATAGPVNVSRKETRKIDLVLISTKPSEPQGALQGEAAPGKPDAHAPEFFDEPQFTVAGVTQATNSGGHGSDTVLRTTEALAKATVSLSKESPGRPNTAKSAATESSLRDAAAREPEDFEANRFPTWNWLHGSIPEIPNFIVCWARSRRSSAIHWRRFDVTSAQRNSTPPNRICSIGERNF
jgi:hypothetical protein